MKKISLISPCFNEESNIEDLYLRVCNVLKKITDYEFEYVFIDNASTDKTVEILKRIALNDSRIKIIVNNRNFGHIRSPYWGILQTSGDATIYLASDLQDPPEMIPQFIAGWEAGYKLVMAIKPVSEGASLMHLVRRSYYKLLDGISNIKITRDTTGFGLYDRFVINELRKINDPYPYLRGLIDELGFPMQTIEFIQPRRIRGITKNNFYTLYDIAILGVISHSMVPIRVASFLGGGLGVLSIVLSIVFTIAKVFFDVSNPELSYPILLILFSLGVVLFFIGLLGEYVGAILTYVRRRPIVTEKERVNFE